ncbi:class I SAM-dependent methyltransferase [Microaerobacter geothermalis]|uniref:class I SAM-dependent methyltransferase n=1 Tax=Microaerobacter geothermalis TaxID=674972 RepID=UPI001F3AE8A5|nr:class I SAM-dependent methyltransferase [Microaerobacter geothermalis]MCF6094789.1 class I SAM-dependent methyltransferase [Microaerobacter geothermalis]
MNEHYYSNKPLVAHDERIIEETLRGRPFRFMTDSGVFSKQRIDFGSRLLIETILVEENQDILDMGCGYGPIGIVAATLTKTGQVLMADINERAVELAKRNVQLNQVFNAEVILSNQFEQLEGKRFHHILINPPIRAGKNTIYQMFSGSYDHLYPNGYLWVVIQKKQGASSAFSFLSNRFDEVEEVEKKKGYSIFRAKKIKYS